MSKTTYADTITSKQLIECIESDPGFKFQLYRNEYYLRGWSVWNNGADGYTVIDPSRKVSTVAECYAALFQI